MCPEISYNTDPLENTVIQFSKTLEEWENFNRINFTGQIATFHGRPVYKIKKDTLKEIVRDCNSKKGSLLEIHNSEELEKIKQIMKRNKIKQLAFNMIYRQGILRWAESGIPFYIKTLEQTIIGNENKFKEIIKYQPFNDDGTEKNAPLAVANDPTNTESLCLRRKSELFGQIEDFKSEIYEQLLKFEEKEQNVTYLQEKLIDEMEKNETKVSDTECWETLITPFREIKYSQPKDISGKRSFFENKKRFKNFVNEAENLHKNLKGTWKILKNSDHINLDIIVKGIKYFFSNITSTKIITITIAVFSILLCVILIWICKKCKEYKNRPANTVHHYQNANNIPLALL